MFFPEANSRQRATRLSQDFCAASPARRRTAEIPFSGRYRSGRRRALAEWIASPSQSADCPGDGEPHLAASLREGIVRTSSDFGKNGDRPSHPELLDWLATQFIENKWSIKAMHRLMLTSNTYRQSTSHPEAKKYAEADPENRLLWRMNWIRLESEVLRDSMLALSGQLNPEAGGPGMFFSVKDEIAQGFQMFKWFPSDERPATPAIDLHVSAAFADDADDGSIRWRQHERKLFAAKCYDGRSAGIHAAERNFDCQRVEALCAASGGDGRRRYR